MCGIIGYIGKRKAVPIVIDGLHRLEYRGYDSAGIATINGEGKIQVVKKVGKVGELDRACKELFFDGGIGIGHTRWATHGEPSPSNTHPHFDCTRSFFVVHNGIIENARFLKDALIREGHEFVSETDTEVLAHLIERGLRYVNINKGSLEDGLIEALRHVEGTFGLAVISKFEPEKIVVARRGSPLILGIGKNEYFVASDASAIISHTRNIVYLHDNEMAVLTPKNYEVFDLSKKKIDKKIERVDWDVEQSQKAGYEHFMLKEIHESPQVVEDALRGRLTPKDGSVVFGGLKDYGKKLAAAKQIIIVSCGTSYYASLVGKYLIEELVNVPVYTECASEFRYHKPILGKEDVFIVVSQSGETADTIGALRLAKNSGALTVGIVNVVGSTIAREVDAGIYNHAGPEIAVASTKAFVSQITTLALFALHLAELKNKSHLYCRKISEELLRLPKKIKRILSSEDQIKKLAQKYSGYKHFLYIGRKYSWPVALEGALKLKEISYIHAEGYPAGEMKHGPIALIDKNFPSFIIAPQDSVFEKIVSNIEEIGARRGRILVLTTKGAGQISKIVSDTFYIPRTVEPLTPILAVIPLQLFAYYVAVLRGCDVDKPRNLAKSVTVE